MNTRWVLAAALLVSAMPASAATPDGTLRVFVSSANPNGDWTGSLEGIDGRIEADSTVGFGMFYEVRLNDRFGLESGFYVADFDFDIEILGFKDRFGSATAIPLTFGANFHPPVGDRVDLYVGPLVSYTVWGNLDTDYGTVSLDRDFGVGGVVGLDVQLGRRGWIFNTGLRYLQTAASDPTAEIDVNPLFAEVGFGFRF